MELTETEKKLLLDLRSLGMSKDQMVGIMLSIRDDERKMKELKMFIDTNNPTAQETIDRVMEISNKKDDILILE